MTSTGSEQMRKMKLLLRRAIGKIFGRWPYRLVLAFLRWQIADLQGFKDLWPRNSFLTEAFVPGVSDIDITLFFEKFDERELRKVLFAQRRTKTLFPWLGELNIYFALDVENFVKFANRFELLRDPQLMKQIKNVHIRDQRVESFLFLLRNLYVDRLNLKSCPEIRKCKWRQHFLDTDMIPPSNWSFDHIINALVALSPVQLSESEIEILKAFLNGDWQASERDTTHILTRLFLHFFPGRISKIEFHTDDLLLLRPQIGWEIFGIYGQTTSLNFETRDNPWLLPGLESYLSFCNKNDWQEEARALDDLHRFFDRTRIG